MDNSILLIAAFIVGILIVFLLWLFWGLNKSDCDDKKKVTPQSKTPPVTKKDSTTNSDLAKRQENIRSSYTGFTGELFHYADGKSLNDVKDGLNKNISTFSDNFCLSGAKLSESKTLHLMYAASLVELVDAVNKYKDLKNKKVLSDQSPLNPDGLDSPMISPSGSHTGIETRDIELTKNNLMKVSESLAESYGKCLMVKKDDLTKLFQTTAMYVFMYTSGDPSKVGLKDRLRKEHDAIVQQLTLKI